MKTTKNILVKLSVYTLVLFTAVFVIGWNSAQAAPYRLGGPVSALSPLSDGWAWDGSYMADFRTALENPANFGPGGVVEREIDVFDLAAINAATLSGLDGFVSSWWDDTDAAPYVANVVNFFLTGGDLLLLQDDEQHDAIGDALGIPTVPPFPSSSTGSVSNGGAPLYDGPFGIANDVEQFYNVGKLDEADILAKGGHVGGTNADGEITAAYWSPGEYAPGAGALLIIPDIDMYATTGGGNGAHYAPLDDNGIYALNGVTFLVETEPIPEPSTLLLLGAGLLGVLGLKRKFKK